MLLFKDSVLAIMQDLDLFLCEELMKQFTLKEKSVGSPEKQLGNNVSQVALEIGVKCWRFSSSQHTQAAAKNIED